ncbi:hypothetical protein H2O64_19970 [Kordia sp. YSTF-M3]|uniref:Uncharacterized protein n=1 Tax=Kordia aestuariivivens TaxID=2759037 RepID=A0ABR7QEF7_9FLAO|nr:hypothetical protein [Kordia aestuariivivens]MBC8756959.1 hypothetical protein [Kordia aestuariivivens]
MKTNLPITKLTTIGKTSLKTFCFFFLLLLTTPIFAQSYVEDAKNLARLQELIELKGGDIDSIFTDEFKKIIVLEMNADVAQPQGDGTSGGSDFPDPDDQEAEIAQPENNIVTDIAIAELDAEIERYKFLLSDISDDTRLNTFVANVEVSSKQLKYLKAAINVLEGNSAYGDGTSVGAIGSLLGVSQAEILQGITDWALSRAQEELMQAFLREWLEKLQNDELLQEAFPNSLTMLETSDLTSIYTDGDTWKATFKQDLNGIPKNAPAIAKLVIDKLKINVKEDAKNELISGLTAITRVFGEINKNKKPDEILLLLGEETFLTKQGNDSQTITDRSIVGLTVFLKAIQQEEDGKLKYVLPAEILKLNQLELEMLWKLLYTGERDKLEFTFNVKDGDESKFFSHVHTNIQNLKLQIVKASEIVNSINTLLSKINALEDQTFSIDLFNSYTVLIFDLVENGMDGISLLTNVEGEKENLSKYKATYIQGFKYISLLHEGVKTKKYGQVALNTVNFISWLKNFTQKNRIPFNIDSDAFQGLTALGKLQQLEASVLSRNQISKLLDETQKIINQKLENYEMTQALVQTRFDIFKNAVLDDNFEYTTTNIKKVLKDYITYSEEEKRTIVKEVASEGLNNFNSSSAAFNKYTKLMASIILAEDSDDIKEALDAVAMKTGGYMVKQQSYFSTTVTFYPGIEFGTERLKSNGIEETDGTYIGANLPIGVEFAVGIDSKLIGSVGLFVQVLDLGAVLNYSLSNDNDDVATSPEFGFEQVLSPGAYITTHFKNNPITLGIGASYSPSLREVTNNGITTSANVLQYGVFLAVDLNVFTIFGSRKKLPLSSTSKYKAYED